jgi:uncharacterized membrane protein YbhN (UPF0104 family)
MVSKRLIYIQTGLFALFGCILLYLSFKQVDFTEVLSIIKSGNNLVIMPVLITSILVYYIRVKRWQLLFETIKINAPTNYLFASLATGYLVNFAIPRLGEVSRALILKQSLNYEMNKSLSTILFERLADMLCLVIIILAAFSLEFLSEGSLLNSFTKGLVLLTPVRLAILTCVLLGAYLLYKQLKNKSNSAVQWVVQLIQSTQTLLKMENKWLFFAYTVMIWIGFYLMTYLWFFMFKESSILSAKDAFFVMVLGVVARTLPIQAGSAGAYHFVVSQALLFMGVNLSTGNALAIIIHGFQTILTLGFGFSAYLWLLNKKQSQNA